MSSRVSRGLLVSPGIGPFAGDAHDGVLLINPPYPVRHGGGLIPPIGLAYLAAALRERGAPVAIADIAATRTDFALEDAEYLDGDVRTLIDAVGVPRLVGIGPLVTANLISTRHIIRSIRALVDSPIVLGGPLCAAPGMRTVAADYLRADAYVAGDGEKAIVDLWERAPDLSGVTASGVWLRGYAAPVPYREQDLDGLAIPARDLLGNSYHASARRALTAGYITAAFLSRGCPYSCTFCAAPLSSGRRIRRFSPPRVQAEIAACEELGYESLIFYDDCLFVRSRDLDKRVHAFCSAISAGCWTGTYQLELRCDAVVAMSTNALEELAATGCRQVNMGIEKGESHTLDHLQKRLSPAIAEEACERLAGAGIRSAGTFIIGGPGEGKQDLTATVDFACALPIDFAHFNPLAIYPGTQLYQEVFGASHWLSFCTDRSLAPLGDILWRDEGSPLTAILDVVKEAYTRFYTTERMERASAKVTEEERPLLANAYGVLAGERGHSWEPVGTPFPATQC